MKAIPISLVLQGLFFVALALTLAPRAAMAQETLAGSFTLPFEVHWGEAVLSAGGYTFTTDSSSPATMCVHKEGSPYTGYFITAQGLDTIPPSSGATKLVIDRQNGEAFVKELQLGNEGLTLLYTAPKLKNKDSLERSSLPERRLGEISSGK